MKGNAVVFKDKEKVAYHGVSLPEPTSTDVVVEVKHSWISPGTESSFLRGERITGEKMYLKGDPWPFPHVAGYQKVGKVIQIGKEVRNVDIGDWVFASVSHVNKMFYPFGGHINPAITHFSQVWKLPEGVEALAYSGLVLAQVGFNCGTRPPVQGKDIAVVIGDGLVGQWTAQTLLHRGAEVFLIGRHQEKLNYLPREVQGINSKEIDIPEVLMQHGPVSVVVDTVGSMESVYNIFPYMKRESHFVSAGFLGNKGMVDIQQLRDKEMTLHTPSGWSGERINQTINGISDGWLQTLPLITHRFPVEQAKEAWQLILEKRESYLGVILDW